jgi:ornithine cyclodeaminase/alanine dehydrogenase-like protein (mu-crystallin family)
MPLLLTETDVRRVLPMADLIDAMAGALAEYSGGRVVQPVRSVLSIGAERNVFAVMPAALDDPPAAGAKLVTVYHRNHARGLPSHLATIVLTDYETGALTALVDGRYITEARTAAVSAVSVRLLARPDARVLALIGSGVQAQSHLNAITRVRKLHEVRVWSPTAAHRRAFVADARNRERAGTCPSRRMRIGIGGRPRRRSHRACDVRAHPRHRRRGRGRRRAHCRRGRVPPR